MRKILLSLLTVIVLFIGISFIKTPILNKDLERLNNTKLSHREFPEVIDYIGETAYISYTDFRKNIANDNADPESVKEIAEDLYIRIDNADELYRFSADVSINHKYNDVDVNKPTEKMISVLLSLNYVLGDDIDYQDMKSKKFIPIGYDFTTTENETIKNVFTGTFDGRGFEIKNLIFADIDKLVFIDDLGEEVTVTQYFAMFTYNEGQIKNLGLIDPFVNVTDGSIDYYSYLVGENDGSVQNVYVISDQGMKLNSYQGVSGLVYQNNGEFVESYFAGSKIVENDNNIFSPVVAENSGIVNNLVYDKTIYPYEDLLAFGEPTHILKSSQSRLTNGWYFYSNYRYPSLIGLKYTNGKYQINDAMDVIAFSKILHYDSYSEASYELTNNIDMNEVSESAYNTPNIGFNGVFDGKSYTIGNLKITNIAQIDKINYGGFFSILSGTIENITFSNMKINITNYDNRFSLNLGLVAGAIDNALINEVLISGQINIENGLTHNINIGGVTGVGNGTITNTCVYGIDGLLISGEAYEYISNSTVYLGGIIGSVLDGKITLINNENNGTIRSIKSNNEIDTFKQGYTAIGGIIGYLNNDYSHKISLLKNNGNIEVYDLHINNYPQLVGGIIGYVEGEAHNLSDGFGSFTNTGVIKNKAEQNIVRAAGIAVVNHSEPSEYIYLQNDNTFESNTFENFQYTALIYNIGVQKITLSQSVNNGDFNYNHYSQHVSPLYISEYGIETVLRFIENKGDINYQNITLLNETYISGISTSSNIDYLNVYFSGNINVNNINSSYKFYVAGITNYLPNKLQNSLTEGTITLNNINNSDDTYVSGLVNINNGEIINSVNASFINASTNNIGNVYGSGIATLSGTTIKDVLNIGNIVVKNIDAINDPITVDNTNANLITSFKGGAIASGISAFTIWDSTVQDSVNSGNVIAISENFVRSAGIVASGLNNSAIINAINYGDISSITKNKGIYSDTSIIETFQYYFNNSNPSGSHVTIATTQGTAERPAVHASSGGIISEGNIIINNTINFGTISSTDVAGGIIGNIFAHKNMETVLNIYGAIHYGKIKALDTDDYNTLRQIETTSELSNFYYDLNELAYPDTTSDIRRYPESKRGFGGIVGRIQRGENAILSINGGKFNLLLNYDSESDLIGRIDQKYNFTDTVRYIRLHNANYYSAKENDTTQAVLTGFTYYTSASYKNIYRKHVTIERERYTLGDIVLLVFREVYIDYDRYVSQELEIENISGTAYTKVGNQNIYRGYRQENKEKDLYVEPYWEESYASEVIHVLELFIGPYLEPKITYVNKNIDQTLESSSGTILWDNIEVLKIPSTTFSTNNITYVNKNNLSENYQDYDGLYVIKTNNGITIPDNINLNKIYRLANKIPYDSNYENINYLHRERLSDDIINKYEDLRLIRYVNSYNLESDLLDDDIVFEDKGEDKVIIENPVSVNYNNKRITFDVGVNEFPSNQNVIDLIIKKINISENAMVGAHIDDYSNHTGINYRNNLTAFRNLLMQGDTISDIVIPELTTNISSYRNRSNKTNNVYIGRFTIYSEAALKSNDYFNNYQTTYSIYFNFSPNVDSPNNRPKEDQIILDGAYRNYNSVGTRRVTNSIGIRFRDNSGVFPSNYKMKHISLYFGNEEVDPEYYTVNVTERNSSGRFEFIITLSDNLRPGNYTIKYKFFTNSNVRNENFVLNKTQLSDLLEVKENGNNIPISNQTFITLTNFGEAPNFNNISWTIIDSSPYSQITTYYVNELNVQVTVLGKISNISIVTQTLNQSTGLYIYTIVYQVTTLDGGTPKTYYHFILENNFDIVNVYNNKSLANIHNLAVSREEVNTIEIDFGIDESLYTLSGNERFIVSYDYSSFEGDNYTSDISYYGDEYLTIKFGLESNPGYYIFTISYYRDNILVNTFNLDVIKNKGVNAYLSNITFDDYSTNIKEISEANSNGDIINSNYNIGFYEEGIDYNGSMYKVFNYRINTYVLDVAEDLYMPELVEYLPIGATISRFNNGTWTPEVNNDSNPKLIDELKANYSSNNIITYRVTSENGETKVYYHIQITDRIYNVTMMFNIFFVDGEGNIIPGYESELNGKNILIKLRNVETNNKATAEPVNYVLDFPSFNEIKAINTYANLFANPKGDSYRYQFAPNLSGYYIFDIDINKELYSYEIIYNDEVLPDVSDYVSDEVGKYFYIEKNLKSRSRIFNVYIYHIDEKPTSWGLTDSHHTWK